MAWPLRPTAAIAPDFRRSRQRSFGEISIADVATCNFSATGCRAVEKTYTVWCKHALEYALWNLVNTTYGRRLAQRSGRISPSAPAEFQVILKTRDLLRNFSAIGCREVGKYTGFRRALIDFRGALPRSFRYSQGCRVVAKIRTPRSNFRQARPRSFGKS